MRQGTVSIICGCHSPIHSSLVVLSWHRLYRKWPKPWELGCIMLHDIGHVSKDYLDNLDDKNGHWKLGARIARRLFGQKGYELIAGHSESSGHPCSRLFYADKYSRYLSPYWCEFLNTVFEPKLRCGMSRLGAVRSFKARVAEGIEAGEWQDWHGIYLDRYSRDKDTS